jgi:hypothetical protein
MYLRQNFQLMIRIDLHLHSLMSIGVQLTNICYALEMGMEVWLFGGLN